MKALTHDALADAEINLLNLANEIGKRGCPGDIRPSLLRAAAQIVRQEMCQANLLIEIVDVKHINSILQQNENQLS